MALVKIRKNQKLIRNAKSRHTKKHKGIWRSEIHPR